MSIECGLPTVSVWQLLKGAYNLLKDPVVYAMSSKSFFDSLKEEVGKLENEARRVEVLAQAARNNVRDLDEVFTEWKKSADKASQDARNRWEAFEDSKSCCYGRLPNPYCHYKFSTEAEAEIKVIRGLAQEGIRFRGMDDISFVGPASAPTTATASVLSASMSVKLRDHGVFESRASMIQNIMDALADNSKSVVGVYGMGGVGKSTLLEDVKRILIEERSFDWVAKADVSKNPNIHTIQGDIAACLKLTDIKKEETIGARAELLHRRLEKEEGEKKKVLIILDNLWKKLDLKLVGIPCGHDNKAIRCKLLLTSRDQRLLQREMGCDREFLLGGLEKEEARALFERKVGDKVHKDEFRPLVNEALHRCAGLPFLIVQMANLLERAGSSEWRDALYQIEGCTNEGISAKINTLLQVSYDHLESEDAKSLLQLCAAYAVSEPSLENLLRYGFGLGIFRKCSSMEKARDRLSVLISTLQASSLLLETGYGDGFKIHDLVRDFVAQFILSDHPLLVLKDEENWETELSKGKLKSCRAICFTYADMKELPRELHCPELQTFLLLTNRKSLEVPDSLFHSMGNLKVLNLIGTHLTCSPSPFQFLKSLNTLCLQRCSLDDVAILGELKGLQILSIVDSDIQRLPEKIGQLVELKLLDLSRCWLLKMIEPGVLGSLIRLEELYMEDSFDQWSAGEETPPTNASLSELNNMKNLRTLHVSIPDPSALPKDLDVEKLTKYKIRIGGVQHWNKYKVASNKRVSRILELRLDPTSDVLRKECIRCIFDKTDDLLLERLNEAEQSICEFSQKGFPQLKHLQVLDSPSIHYILRSPSLISFKALESMRLEGLINLEKICHKNISTESFSTLKVVKVESCKTMKVLFPRPVVRELPHLEEIEVVRCELMRGIVEADDNRGKLELPKLRGLKLRGLPNIENFFSAGSSPSRSTSDDQVDTQIAFFNGQEVAFPSLETLEVSGLGNPGFMFSPSMVKSLAQLRKLSVSNCKKMEAIVMEEEGLGVEISETLSFPMLTDLSLEWLESLTCFSSKKCSQEGQSQDRVQSRSSVLFNREVALPSLETLKVERLGNPRFIFSPSTVKSLAKLRNLTVSDCKKMEAIITEEEGLGVEISETLSFPMLTDLHLTNLGDLTSFSSEKVSQEGRNQDRVQSCSSVLFNREVSFPFLDSLTIEGLPNLKEIWSDESPLESSNLQSLKVVRCESLSKVISSKSLVKLHKLQTLCIHSCNSVQEIFYPEGPSAHGDVETLSELTTLELNKLGSLSRIWNENPNGIVSFHKLKEFKLHGCDSLEFIFFPSMVKSLAQLRDLKVSNCKKMETIIAEEEGLGMEISETLAFSMLTNLQLDGLEGLKCFSREKCSRETQSQDRVNSHSAALFSGEVAFPSLETLEVNGLDNVGFMFSPSMVKFLAQLRGLWVVNCDKMKAIIMEEEGLGVEISETLSFPMLTNLSLRCLESLMCFSSKKCSREGQSQDRVQSNVLFNREVAFPNLESFSIARMDNIEMIWDNQVVAESFPKLKSLFVDECNKLVTVVPPFVLRQLKSLESLKVEACGSIQVVFGLQQLIPLDGHPVALPLKELKVSGLPKLMCVWDKELHRQVKFQRLRSVSVSECNSLTSMFPASVTRDLIQLEELVIRECGIAELIEKEEGLQVPRFVFPKLTSLELEHLTELKCLYNGTHTSHWPTLKTLKMDDCSKVEILASQTENEIPCHKQPLFLIEKGAFPNLQEVELDLCERMEIWHGDFHDEEFFCKLRVLELRHLSKESATSTSRFIESLTNLEKLVVRESYLEEPSSNVEATEGPSQEQKVILPFSRQIKHLKALNVSDCDGLSSMFTPTIAKNLLALTQLRISNCKILTEVISDKGSKEGHEVAFHHLKCMELDGLIELKCFSSGGCALIFPLLEDVIVNGCPNMRFFSEGPLEAPKLQRVKVGTARFWKENLNMTIQNMFKEMATIAEAEFVRLFEFPELIGKWHNEHNPVNSSWRLETLVVDKCPSFINAMPSKLMLVLEKMTSLHVRDCESLEEIFNLQGLETVENTRLLPRLKDLSFINLPKLRQLWNKDLQGTMRFNALSSLTLYKCSNLRYAFTPSMAWCLANLYHMEIKECDQMEGVIEDEEGQGSAVEKITFPWLGQMILKRLPNLTSFLSGKKHALDCPKLHYLRIAHCPKMRSLTWQSSMDIDQNTPSLFTPRVQFHGLWEMALSHMDNLSKIWTDNPLETLTFDSLLEVKVKNCKSLENLFPHWVATSLTQLKKLRMESCRIEEIVANGDDTPHSDIAQVLFPKLTSLVLHDMPQLKTFCPNLPTSNWPFLKELRVTHCDKVNMLSFAASMNKWTQRNDQQDLLDQEAHSSFERDFPNLGRLLLVHKDIEMIQDGKYPDDIFGKSKALTLACFHDEKAVFPSRFLLERFQNVESLEVFCSSFEDIFPDEGFVDEERNSVLESLRELKLSKLRKLKRVWREDGLVSKILRSIETLEVWDCPGLTILFPAVTSFQNLSELVVKNSSGLVHLGTASAIASMVHLSEMTIIGCERMEEVVAQNENGEKKVICFRILHKLTLKNMPSLECFSSATSCILRFPFLREVEVEECPKMNIFSKGDLSTPELWRGRGTLFRYKLGYGRERMGDLNKAIQKLSA